MGVPFVTLDYPDIPQIAEPLSLVAVAGNISINQTIEPGFDPGTRSDGVLPDLAQRRAEPPGLMVQLFNFEAVFRRTPLFQP